MIESIELTNFKSIKNHLFPLRNLNIFLGLNGMGKSSFIQTLLLLKQSENLKSGILKLNGEYVEIGECKDAFYQYSQEDKMIFDIVLSNKVSQTFHFSYESSKNDYFKATEADSVNLDLFEESLFKNKFQYLNANRIEPTIMHAKSHSAVVNQRFIGKYGQFAVHYLNEFNDKEIAFENLVHIDSWEYDPILDKKVLDKTLAKQVNKWLGEISPGVRLTTTEIPNSPNILLEVQFEQPTLGYTNKFRPTNVGFGISYVLPILVAILSAQAGDIIIIENPESHIHPRGQAELGKLLGLAALNDIQVFVETHSDHIVNGIRVAVKEKNEAKEKIILFYFEKELEEKEQYSKVSDIEINKNGDLSFFPDNLLNEWSNQLMKLL